jgi:hypothetical protein
MSRFDAAKGELSTVLLFEQCGQVIVTRFFSSG